MMPSTCSGSAGWGKRDSSGIASHEPIGSSAMASKVTEAMATRREPRRRAATALSHRAHRQHEHQQIAWRRDDPKELAQHETHGFQRTPADPARLCSRNRPAAATAFPVAAPYPLA